MWDLNKNAFSSTIFIRGCTALAWNDTCKREFKDWPSKVMMKHGESHIRAQFIPANFVEKFGQQLKNEDSKSFKAADRINCYVIELRHSRGKKCKVFKQLKYITDFM